MGILAIAGNKYPGGVVEARLQEARQLTEQII
jgi:hypothetical protein